MPHHKIIAPVLSKPTSDSAAHHDEDLRQVTLLKTGALQNAILNSANFSSIATDEKGVIQIFNIGAERMLGYAAADVLNKLSPADISDAQELVERAETLSMELATQIDPGFEALVFKASRGIEDVYELTYIRKDGSRLPAIVSVTALRDEEGMVIGYLLIGTDNTSRKQIEMQQQQLLEIQEQTNIRLQQANATLQLSEEKLAVTLNSIGDAVIATDSEARVTLLNPLAERMTGWTWAEAVGQPVSEVFHIINKESRKPSTIPVMDTLKQGTVQGLANHTVVIARDGSEHDIADSCAPICDRDGQVIGAVLVFHDVTKEYVARQILRDYQFYTRSLIESNIDAITVTDPAGIITDVNRQMEVLTGCTRDELIGTPFRNYFTDPALAEAGIKQVLRDREVTNYELSAHARDNKETIVSFNANTFHDRNGVLQGVFAAARDVTERKRLDQLLQDKNAELELAKQLAERANLAKSEFLSSMSHELRTPLNAILGFAQLLEAGSPLPTAAQMERLQQIIKAGWYLLELINEILDLAIIESGKLSMSPEPVLLFEVLHECQAMIEPQAQKRGIRLVFYPVDNSWVINADRTRIKQVLINLLSNAIKYNRDQGTVDVVCTENTDTSLRISVIDSGIGLSPEKLSRLFQPFNRLGQESGNEEGTGIGLVVTKRLIELMDGSIGVTSTVGTGSEFWVELKRISTAFLASGQDFLTGKKYVNQCATENFTLLYVEDNPANLMLVEQIIADRPHINMLSARDGKRGIALARARLPNIILMDINLPGINGTETMDILRTDKTTEHIPVIALSANAMPRDVERGLEAGFFRYLTKPIRINELMSALDDALKSLPTNQTNPNNTGITP